MRKSASLLAVFLILSFVVVFPQKIGLGRTYDYIYIKEDGSIEPLTAPIQRSGNIYTLYENSNISLIVEKDDIVLDGAGFTLEGPGFGDSPPRINMTGISNLTITNMILRGPNHGIVMSNCSYIKIMENDIEIRLGKKGIILDSSSNVSIKNNRIIGKAAAVELLMSSNNTISDNYLSTFTGSNGILLYNSSNNNIKSNFFYSSTHGINLYYSNGNKINNNNFTSHWISIALESSFNNQLVENIMEDHKRMTYDVGFQMNNSDNNDFIGNTIKDSQRCIQIDYSSNNRLENNTITTTGITDTNSWGIRLTESSNISIIGNNLNLETLNEDFPGIVFGILLEYSLGNQIIDNNVTYFEGGLGVKLSHNNTISVNIIKNNLRGFDLSASENNVVLENYIINNTDGIALEGLHNSIFGNIIANNDDNGVFLNGAGYNNIKGNTIVENNVGINIRTCMNNLLTQNNVSYNHNAGVFSFRSEKDVIANNSITDNGGNGIETESSMVSCVISENDILNNGLNGFHMDWASNTTITKNRIQNNTENGIRVYESRNNTISKNIIDDNKANGIYLQTYSFLSLIFLNNITSNSETGIDVNQYSSDNLIHHNNFVDNGNQAATYAGETNRWGWDNGFPSGGNYWSNYNGTDSNMDGLGDTPYIISENNQDNYPLMEPYDITANQEFTTIPEFPSWTILPLFLIASIIVIVCKKKLTKT